MPSDFPSSQSSSRLERAAQAAWTWAEEREQRIAADNGRVYKPVSWENAHDLDRAEYREYIDVVSKALAS
jgi:hypothetical protein